MCTRRSRSARRSRTFWSGRRRGGAPPEREEQLRQAQKMEAVGHPGRGRRPRLQQPAHGHPRLQRAGAGEDRPRLRRRRRLRSHPAIGRRRAGRGAHPAAAGVQPQAGRCEPKVVDVNAVVANMTKILAASSARTCSWTSGSTPDLARAGRSRPARAGAHEPGGQRARRDAPGRAADDRDGATSSWTRSTAGARRAASPGRYVMLAVTDTGIGMDAEMQAQHLRAVLHDQGPGKGTGLGLSTVYGIVQAERRAHRRLQRAGAGTTFKIYLPRVGQRRREPDQAAAPRGERPGRWGPRRSCWWRMRRWYPRLSSRRVLELNGYEVIAVGGRRGAAWALLVDDTQSVDLLLDRHSPARGAPGQRPSRQE